MNKLNKQQKYLHKISHKRIDPPGLTGDTTVPRLIEEVFLSYNAGRLREACRLFASKDAGRRHDRWPVALRRPDAGGPGHLLPGAARRGRLHRLDRQHRRQPLPRHAFRPGHGHAPVAARPRTICSCASTRSSASTTSSSTTKTCSAPIASTARCAAARRFRRRWAPRSFTTSSASTWPRARTSTGCAHRSLLAAAYRCGVPIFTSSPGDSSIGMNLAALQLEGSELRIDPLRDVNQSAAIV